MPQYPQHADPLWRRYQTPPGAIAGLMGAGSTLLTQPDDSNDPGTPTPPADPNIIMGQDYIPRYQPEDISTPAPNIPAPPSPPLTPFQQGTHNFGGPATQPGDIAALTLHQTQQDPNIALEGLQQARKSEFEDRATQLLKTGNPADVGPAMAWKGQAERYEGDLANPNTPLNKMRGIDSANTAAQQAGFGLPTGQALSPTQQQGQYTRNIETQKAGSPLAVANAEATSRENVATIQNQGMINRYQALQDYMTAHPGQTGAINIGNVGVKPMAPNQTTPQGALGLGEQKLLQNAIDKQRTLRGPFGRASALMSGKSLEQAQADADADVARLQGTVNPRQPAPTVSGVQPAGQGGTIIVTDPNGGQHPFDDQAAANRFRQAIGGR